MKLTIHPYDPKGALRERASAALTQLATEWRAAPVPLVPKDARDDLEERGRAASRKWRKTPAARENNRRRMAARREAARA